MQYMFENKGKWLKQIKESKEDYHNELNPKLWDNKSLKSDVSNKLKEIAKAFIDYLDINEDAIEDIVITGSSAGYNYTPYSDLDLHLVVDYDKVHKDCPIVEGFLWSMKSQFNKDHDISIYGIPVELYAEQSGAGTVHNGLYSLMLNKWIDEPKKIVPPDNDAAVEAKYNELKEAADKIEDSEVAKELLNKIYTMRKAGLSNGGELSTENLAFKKLRNDGTIEKLKQMEKEQIDKELSLEDFSEDPLDEIDEDYQVRNKKSGKIYSVKRVNPELHELVKDIKPIEPKQHSTDKVTISKTGEPVIGTHPVDYEYDDNDSLVAVDKVEKELSTNLAASINKVRKLSTIIKGLKSDIKKEKDSLEYPYVDHGKVLQNIKSLEEKLAQAISKQKVAKTTMRSNSAKLDNYYKNKGEN